MLSSDLTRIHQASLRILSELGIRTDHAQMRERMADLGCVVSGEKVCFPEELVEKTLDTIPRSFQLYGRNDTKVVSVNTVGPFLCTNTGIMPNIYDFESGIVRRSVLTDVETTTRVLDGLSEVDIIYVSLLDATNVPAHMVTVSDLAATLSNTTKPLVGPGITNGLEAKTIIELAFAIRNGDQRELVTKPPYAPFICPITPLGFPTDVVDALIEIALSGLPLTVITNPVMGATAPYTIASNVALGHAEILAAFVMANALRPGIPVLSLNTPSVADMRMLTSTTGGPETGLMRSLAVRVSRQLGIPSWGHGHTSSTRMDVQAADEKALNSLLVAQACPSLLGGLGGLSNVTLTSYETLILDNERFGAVRRIVKGVSVDEDHLAHDLIVEILSGKNIITQEHTLRHLRGEEVWRPKLVRRQGLVNGQPDGPEVLENARAEAKRIIDSHIVEPLPEAVQSSFNEIIRAYDREYRSIHK